MHPCFPTRVTYEKVNCGLIAAFFFFSFLHSDAVYAIVQSTGETPPPEVVCAIV